MISFRLISLVCLVICSLGFLVRADLCQDEIFAIAEKICQKPKEMQGGVSSISDMIRVIDSFETKASCREKYLSSMESLKTLLETNNEDVCSDRKISLLEDFNRKYLSTAVADANDQRSNKYKAPEVAKVFFVHYAYQVSSVCKQNLLNQLTDSATDEDSSEDLNEFDEFLARFSTGMALDLSKRGYRDMIMPWKILELARTRENPKSNDERPIEKLSIRLNGADKLHTFQQACSDRFRPIYADSVLPVLRLVGLGLYADDEPLAGKILSDKNLRRLIEVTQICETLLHIEAFEDASLQQDKVVVMKESKAQEFRAKQPEVAVFDVTPPQFGDSGSAAVSMVGVNELGTLKDQGAADKLVKSIKVSRKDQEKLVERVEKMIMKRLKKHMKSKLGHLFALSKNQSNPESSEQTTQVEFEGVEIDEQESRRKRSVAHTIKTVTWFVGYGIFLIVCVAVALILQGIIYVFGFAVRSRRILNFAGQIDTGVYDFLNRIEDKMAKSLMRSAKRHGDW